MPDREESPRVAVIETHVSTLFFVDDRVYKLRKKLQFGFLDFRRRETRYKDCHREVMLNRRLAPDVYMGVADLRLNGELIDHMVVMRRLPEERRLAYLARQGDDLGEWVRKVAETMDTFHRNAQRSPEMSEAATGPALQEGWDTNFSETAPFVGKILAPEVDEEIRGLVHHWIQGRQPLFDARIAADRICDGHGDLQAEDIFCLDEGVRILDCIEFSDQLRYGDVCTDMAFLAMDLERLGRIDAAKQLLGHYQFLANDRFPASLVHHYIASRAYVRAKVACLRVTQGNEASRNEARQLHSLALAHLRQGQVKLVLIGGLPGSGKSTVAAEVARTLGWSTVRSDDVRHTMALTVAETRQGYSLGRYTPAATAAVYNELLRQAQQLLMRGESVILDASWVDVKWRFAAQEVASQTESNLVQLCCYAEADVADTRIVRRTLRNRDVSEATPDVRQAMQEVMDPWPSAIVIDTTGSLVGESATRVLDILVDGNDTHT